MVKWTKQVGIFTFILYQAYENNNVMSKWVELIF
jgi:hypothetical protein